MKNLKVSYLLLFSLMLSSTIYSQQRAVTSIRQNVNEEAHGLEQKLNFTLDTLTLRSTSDILRVTFLDHNAKDSHIIDVGAKEIKIPLYHFKKGRYTIAVYTHDKIIALGANRLNDIPVPEDAIEDLEESIFRSSLSDDELASRNIKPRKKKVRTSLNDNTRVTAIKPKREVNKKPTRKPKVKDTRVAKAKPKREIKEKRVAEAKPNRVDKTTPKPKRETKKRPKSKGKSAFVLGLEKKESEKKLAAVAKKDISKIEETSKVIASVEPKTEAETIGTLITVKKVTYNLSSVNNDDTVDRQSREEYRANNLRPNGKVYED